MWRLDAPHWRVRLCRASYDRQLDYDLGNLAAFDATPVDAAAFRNDTDAACLDIASRMTQSLVAQIFLLPKTSDPRVVELPNPTTRLPRGKAIPKPKPLTKWQKFAQDKGLTRSTKRSSMVWDETAQDWKRRHGYDRGNDPAAVPIIEASHKDLVRPCLSHVHPHHCPELLRLRTAVSCHS